MAKAKLKRRNVRQVLLKPRVAGRRKLIHSDTTPTVLQNFLYLCRAIQRFMLHFTAKLLPNTARILLAARLIEVHNLLDSGTGILAVMHTDTINALLRQVRRRQGKDGHSSDKSDANDSDAHRFLNKLLAHNNAIRSMALASAQQHMREQLQRSAASVEAAAAAVRVGMQEVSMWMAQQAGSLKETYAKNVLPWLARDILRFAASKQCTPRSQALLDLAADLELQVAAHKRDKPAQTVPTAAQALDLLKQLKAVLRANKDDQGVRDVMASYMAVLQGRVSLAAPFDGMPSPMQPCGAWGKPHPFFSLHNDKKDRALVHPMPSYARDLAWQNSADGWESVDMTDCKMTPSHVFDEAARQRRRLAEQLEEAVIYERCIVQEECKVQEGDEKCSEVERTTQEEGHLDECL